MKTWLAKLNGSEFKVMRTDAGAPARLKTATDSQIKWQELAGWRESNHKVYLLWELIDKPKPVTEPVIDKQTGEPLADQLPPHCHP